MSDPYLQRLTGQLIDGVDRLPVAFREQHARWVRERQLPDGGFSGREGGSDLYYTAFALRSLAVLQGLDESVSNRAAEFLRSRMTSKADAIDLFSFLVATFLVQIGGGPDILAEAPPDWAGRVATVFETHRHADGGYSKSPGGTSGSTYTTFLILLALELLQKSAPETERIVSFLRGRYRNGGFVEIPQMKRAGTNPTAAGVGSLQVLGQMETQWVAETAGFLAGMYQPGEGGLRANDRIPAADLLSTFTGSWTLSELGELDRLNRSAIRSYAIGLQTPEGGFRGGNWDAGADVEYTFYGIGVLGLLAE